MPVRSGPPPFYGESRSDGAGVDQVLQYGAEMGPQDGYMSPDGCTVAFGYNAWLVPYSFTFLKMPDAVDYASALHGVVIPHDARVLWFAAADKATGGPLTNGVAYFFKNTSLLRTFDHVWGGHQSCIRFLGYEQDRLSAGDKFRVACYVNTVGGAIDDPTILIGLGWEGTT